MTAVVEKCVHAWSSTYASTPRDGTWRSVALDVEGVDTGGYHSTVTNNSRITFPTGTWLVLGAQHRGDAGPGNGNNGRLAKNGVGVGYEYTQDGFVSNDGGSAPSNGTTLFWIDGFTAGDYMEVQEQNNQGGTGACAGELGAMEISDWSCMVGGTAASAASPQVYPTTIYDPHGMHTSSTTLTVQKAGYYLVFSSANGQGNAAHYVRKNGSGSALNGSYAESEGVCDYTFDWFEIGDTVQVLLTSGSQDYRQFGMAYMGGSKAVVAYAYIDSTYYNTISFFEGKIRCNTEWFDTGKAHPKDGFIYDPGSGICTSCGKFNMAAGYHLALAKISTDGGTFLINDSAYLTLNGVPFTPYLFSTNRHQRGELTTALAFAFFSCAKNDIVVGQWAASTTYIAALFSPKSNVFVTDAGVALTSQIYRRPNV